MEGAVRTAGSSPRETASPVPWESWPCPPSACFLPDPPVRGVWGASGAWAAFAHHRCLSLPSQEASGAGPGECGTWALLSHGPCDRSAWEPSLGLAAGTPRPLAASLPLCTLLPGPARLPPAAAFPGGLTVQHRAWGRGPACEGQRPCRPGEAPSGSAEAGQSGHPNAAAAAAPCASTGRPLCAVSRERGFKRGESRASCSVTFPCGPGSNSGLDLVTRERNPDPPRPPPGPRGAAGPKRGLRDPGAQPGLRLLPSSCPGPAVWPWPVPGPAGPVSCRTWGHSRLRRALGRDRAKRRSVGGRPRRDPAPLPCRPHARAHHAESREGSGGGTPAPAPSPGGRPRPAVGRAAAGRGRRATPSRPVLRRSQDGGRAELPRQPRSPREAGADLPDGRRDRAAEGGPRVPVVGGGSWGPGGARPWLLPAPTPGSEAQGPPA